MKIWKTKFWSVLLSSRTKNAKSKKFVKSVPLRWTDAICAEILARARAKYLDFCISTMFFAHHDSPVDFYFVNCNLKVSLWLSLFPDHGTYFRKVTVHKKLLLKFTFTYVRWFTCQFTENSMHDKRKCFLFLNLLIF